MPDPIMAPRLPRQGYFVILFEARTGISYVVSALNQHSQVLCYPEILPSLSKDDQARAIGEFFAGRPVEAVAPWAFNWDFFPSHPDQKPRPTLAGFKTQLEYVHDQEFLREQLERACVRLIRLRRRNPVKLAVSMIRGERYSQEHGGRWNVPAGLPPGDIFPISQGLFDRVLRERMAESSNCDRFFAAYDGPRLDVCYEDLISNHDHLFMRLFEFLEVPVESVSGLFRKNTDDKLWEVVTNIYEIAKAYRGSPLADWFDLPDRGSLPE